MSIHWFPGHMAKTLRLLKEDLKLVDAILELRDSRIVKSSANPEIEKLAFDKPKIIILNKSDLSEEKVTREWIKALTTDKCKVIAVNCVTGEGLKLIKPSLDSLLSEKLARQKSKGIQNITTRAMVLGIPNVGKSSFINKIAKNGVAKTGNKPGITKNKQWLKTSLNIELLDTPGILWPRFEDEEVSLNLAFTGAIKDEIIDINELAIKLIDRLKINYSQNLKERFKIEDLSPDSNSIEILDTIAKKRGSLLAGGRIDYERVSRVFLDEFRSGRLGRISLEYR